MKRLNNKLKLFSNKIYNNESINIAILGLGSVGSYLLDYLYNLEMENIKISVLGRDIEKLRRDVNIIRISNAIRNNRDIEIDISVIDLNNVDQITSYFIEKCPDIIINCSRVYSGTKYGSISWNNLRAYGIWTPLSIKYAKNIMIAYSKADSDAIVINTSYSDAVNPWLKSAGVAYPDFGSGNLNHLIPRIKFSVADQFGIKNIDKIDVTLATGHFHDVVMSKEGHDEGITPLIAINFNGKTLDLNLENIFKECAISMPTDARRNQMNASSNFEIIDKLLKSIKNKSIKKIHCPGVVGKIGGYPVIIDFSEGCVEKKHAHFFEEYFSLDAMQKHNRKSMYMDGIENITNGVLTYTDELLIKVKERFNVYIPKQVHFDDIENVAQMLIEKIITQVKNKTL